MEVDAHRQQSEDDHEQEPAFTPVRLEKGHGQQSRAYDAREDGRVSESLSHEGRLRL
jgi:hypothetical protein